MWTQWFSPNSFTMPLFVLSLLFFPLLFAAVTSVAITARSSSVKKELLLLVATSVAITR